MAKFTNILHQLKRTTLKTTATATIFIATLEVTTHLPSEGRSSGLYLKLSNDFVTPLMRNLLPAEVAHDLALWSLKYNLGPVIKIDKPHDVDLSITPFKNFSKISFKSCIGLAAGFDKNGTAVGSCFDLGFGFIEIGTVTPLPQEGNEKPRMWRLKDDNAIINRYGFNSEGLDIVEQNLKEFRQKGNEDVVNEEKDDDDEYLKMILNRFKYFLPSTVQTVKSKQREIIGVNIGKNKETPKEESYLDYKKGIEKTMPYASYIVMNLSSPNTPGLRDLQHELESFFSHVLPSERTIPILIKIAPDLTSEELKEIADKCLEYEIDGIIVANTTVKHPATLVSKSYEGGLSGPLLHEMSLNCIKTIYSHTNGTLPIIGVGGIQTGQDVYEKLKAGACCVQLYTSMIYKGPGVVKSIQEELNALLYNNGYTKVEDVIGLDHDDIYWSKRQAKLRLSNEKVVIDGQFVANELNKALGY